MAEIYGLTTEGFNAKTYEVQVEEIKAAYRAAFGLSAEDDTDTPDGVVLAIVARQLTKLWELGERVHNAQIKSAATGAALAQIGLLTNTLWQGATRSTTVLTLTGLPTTLVAAGSQASTASTAKKFETSDAATIVATSAWLASTAYVEGARVTRTGNVYVALNSGVSGTTGPSGTSSAIADGTMSWRFVGAGTGDVDVDAVALETGPTKARSGDITVIETPVSGLLGVMNLHDAMPGANQQTDAEFRLAIEDDLQSSGSSPVPAIRAAIRDVDGVTAATVFHNPGEVTDADGLPPKSVEVLVEGGDDQDIFDALHHAVAGGIGTHGTTTGYAFDVEGTEIPYAFSRVEEVDVWVSISLEKSGGEYVAGSDDQVKDAIVEWGRAQRAGRDVEPTAISAQAFKVPGVVRVTQVLVGDANPPVSTARIELTKRERAVYDSSRITVLSTNGEP